VTLVNALGAGVLETQALLAFLPAICERLLGAPLLLPNVATWWLGDDAARAHVRAEAGRMTVGPALATRLPWETGTLHAVAGVLRGAGAAEGGGVDAWIEAGRGMLVGQEDRHAVDSARLGGRRARAAPRRPARLPRAHL
jgi:uncharacterized circularly permuted ATP-grasp superfamily protein